MFYQFFAGAVREDGACFVNIPFNVWEVCDTQGTLSVRGTVNDTSFTCELDPLGKGMYRIPVDDTLMQAFSADKKADIRFEILNRKAYIGGESPYSFDEPIRRIDSMKLITQPNDGLCGQTCIAMLAGVTLEQACEIMHCRDWQASMGKMVDTLDYLGLSHEATIHYASGPDTVLPKCAILMEKMGRYSHYLVIYDGVFYDPTEGIIDDFDMSNLVGFLKIMTVTD